jgi:hypothetical protein
MHVDGMQDSLYNQGRANMQSAPANVFHELKVKICSECCKIYGTGRWHEVSSSLRKKFRKQMLGDTCFGVGVAYPIDRSLPWC